MAYSRPFQLSSKFVFGTSSSCNYRYYAYKITGIHVKKTKPKSLEKTQHLIVNGLYTIMGWVKGVTTDFFF